MSYPVPKNEPERLKAIERLNILDTEPEEPFDHIAETAKRVFDVEYSAVSLIPAERQWFKARCGIDFGETERENAFCTHAIAAGEMLVVEDTTSDERFGDNPLVVGEPNIRFYAGVPLTVEGLDVGTLCIFDDAPRTFTESDREILARLARIATVLLEARLRTYQVSYLTAALEQVDEPVFILEGNPEAPSNAEIVWTNEEYTRLVGREPDELAGTTPWIFENLEEGSELESRVRRALQSGTPVRGETSGQNETGEAYFLAWLVAPVREENGQITHWASVLRDVTDQKVRESQLEYQANHDPLTGLLNRSAIEARIEAILESKESGGALLYLDLDRFKQVNDTLGHSAGDELLHKVAVVLSNLVREQDAVGRIGGDEFVVCCAAPIDEGTAEALAKRIREAFDQPFTVQGEQLGVGCSVGLVADISAYETAEAALGDADVAMYEAKQAPDRTVVTHNSSMSKDAEQRRRLDPLFRDTDEAEGFETFLHPIVALADGTLAGFEVLARWRREDGTLASPASFLDIAEETGSIVSIGRQVIEGGCRTLQRLRRDTAVDLSVTLSGNFSRREFFQTETYDFIEDLLDTYDLPAENFTMEITERLAEEGSDSRPESVQKLRSLGINMEIDDFGTGYSSLHTLLQFPADGLKLDKGLTSEITSGNPGYNVARSVVEMGHSLDMYVTAEGIETAEQLSALREMGCHYGQGYLFSPPVSAGDVGVLAERFPLDVSDS